MTWAGWTDDNVETARKLYIDECLSATEVARRMNAPGRGSIAGKAHRLGWQRSAMERSIIGRCNVRRAKRRDAMESPTEVRPPAAVTPAILVDDMNPKPWLQREFGECAYPIGDGWDVQSCCAPVKTGTAYCSGHHKAMFRKTRPLTERSW